MTPSEFLKYGKRNLLVVRVHNSAFNGGMRDDEGRQAVDHLAALPVIATVARLLCRPYDWSAGPYPQSRTRYFTLKPWTTSENTTTR